MVSTLFSKALFCDMFLKAYAEKTMSSTEAQPDVLENITRHASQLKQLVPKHAAIGIGEYPIKIISRGSLIEKTNDALPLFIDKSSKNILKWCKSSPSIGEQNALGLDSDVDAHFWFQVLHHITEKGEFTAGMKNRPIDKLNDALILSSVWDGPGSALLPLVITHLRMLNISTLALVLLPSKAQSSDASFNAFSAMRSLGSKDLAPVVLIDRDYLEKYDGVDRKGAPINGNDLTNYVLEMLLAKEAVVQEVAELSRAFDVKFYTMLSATGVSFQLYGSLKNMLSTALFRPLLKFDLASASVLYALIRVPLQLKDKLSKGKVELEVAAWFKERANFRSVYLSEPVYVDEPGDRIDLVMLVGGFGITELMASLEKKSKSLANDAIVRGLLSKEEWQAVSASSDEYYRTILSK